MGKISPPELINHEHVLSQFDCGHESLNEWLRKSALKNENTFSKTRVVCIENVVIAYYTLAIGSICREDIVKKMLRNAPEQLGVVLLARLAVDKNWQKKGIAKHLLKQAIIKTVEISNNAGVCGLLVHAIDDDAQNFYTRFDFLACPDPKVLILPLKDILNSISN